MKVGMLARRLHKWLALAVGLQLLVWALSGFYMVTVHIDIIHGDMLVGDAAPVPAAVLDAVLPVEDVLAQHPGATELSLRMRGEQPVYLVRGPGNRIAVDAVTGVSLPPVDAELAAELAALRFSGDAPVAAVSLVEENPPTEIAMLPLPVWRVDFDDRWGTSFYLDPETGRFMTRRHTLWRVFDFLWMLHIMDYEAREDINNPLLRVFTMMALLLAFSGSWLLYLRFAPGHRRA